MAGIFLFVLGIVLGIAVSPWFFALAAVPIIVTMLTTPTRYR
jgi:hypothetical protein